MPREITLEVTYTPQEIEEMLIATTKAHLGSALTNSAELAGLRGKFMLGHSSSRIYGNVTVIYRAQQEDGNE